MAARRFSRLQKRLLAWLATEEQRTRGMISSSHQDLVGALKGDKGNISQSLRTLEARGLLVIVRSHGGKAAALYLTSAGQQWARQFTGSCDEGNSAGEEELGCLGSLPPSRGLACLQGRGSQGLRPGKNEVAWKVVHSKMGKNETD